MSINPLKLRIYKPRKLPYKPKKLDKIDENIRKVKQEKVR